MTGQQDKGWESMRSSRTTHTRDEPYLALLRDVDFLPILILGYHRSGTTLFYRLLTATQCFNVVSAYHFLRCEKMLFNHVNQREDDAKEQLGSLVAGHLSRFLPVDTSPPGSP
jgi:hypothetical protein